MPTKRLKYDWSATNIRALRRHLDMTQEEMSEELGVRQQTVSDWELGYHQPRGGMARLLTIVAERAEFGYDAYKTTPSSDEPSTPKDDEPSGNAPSG